MHKLEEIIVILIIAIVLGYLYNKYAMSNSESQALEGFTNKSQNYIYGNNYGIADQLEYGAKNPPGLYHKEMHDVMGPSQNTGVDDNSRNDIYDKRGFKWSENAKNPQVDEFTYKVDDQQMKQQFERTYMLDPDGSVAKYDISYNTISPNCCPAQYAPPFKLTDKNETNCDYAQKYVANQYSGMNFADGYGCVCMTPTQAQFYGNRGGNTE
ncbi:MAG: hypothetical protein Gaeavirus32_2 [Gaeavirus sp.]|uniref:Uncharacterized protein n=1 Tax=Gaeavirus sp. TaxID=2487767 RepID=A0A3G5A1E4_9VIRU|nr:MAG: hypothetical protein Gaeavirus32_2 [Gaeavirus sp.]